MITRYKNLANYTIAPAFVLAVGMNILSKGDLVNPVVHLLVSLLCYGCVVAGAFFYARAKGYSQWWGLLGLLSLLGLLILCFFPDREKNAVNEAPEVFE